jgi:putative Holliday junction resolvase
VRRLLGVDLGDRRIGVAIADPESGRVRPLATLRRGTPQADAATLSRLAAEQGAGELVVGLPLDAAGGEGAQATATRAWAEAVAPIMGLPLHWRDERHTSQAAEVRLGPMPRGRAGGAPSSAALRARRARVDQEAAVLILQAELDARGSGQAR